MDKNHPELDHKICKHNPLFAQNAFLLWLIYTFSGTGRRIYKTGVARCSKCGALLQGPEECSWLSIKVIQLLSSACLSFLCYSLIKQLPLVMLDLSMPILLLTAVVAIACSYLVNCFINRGISAFIYSRFQWREADIAGDDDELYEKKSFFKQSAHQEHNRRIQMVGYSVAMLLLMEQSIAVLVAAQSFYLLIAFLYERRYKLIPIPVISFLISLVIVILSFSLNNEFLLYSNFFSCATAIVFAFIFMKP